MENEKYILEGDFKEIKKSSSHLYSEEDFLKHLNKLNNSMIQQDHPEIFQDENGNWILKGIFQEFEIKNRGRIYPIEDYLTSLNTDID